MREYEISQKRESIIDSFSREERDMWMTDPFFRTSIESLIRGGNEVEVIKNLCLIIKSQQVKIQYLIENK